MSISRIIGGLVVLGIIVGACAMSGLAYYIDIPSFIFVAGVTIGSMVYKSGIKGLRYWGCPEMTQEERSELAIFAGRSCIVSGILGFFVGLIGVFSHLSDPAQIGPHLAVALLTVVYSIIFYLLFFLPFRFK